MKRKLMTLLVTLVGLTASAQTIRRGDMNGDGEISIADVTVLVDLVLGKHTYVDLGLPSGTLWATTNIGANFPEEYGGYFAWGETEPKSTYNWSTYKWGEYPFSKYNDSDGLQCLEPEDDAARVLWGSEWHIPAQEQSAELYDECDWTWVVFNGVSGRKVTSRMNGNYIFLPAAGCYDGSSLLREGQTGYFWTSTIHTDNYKWAWDRKFTSGSVGVSDDASRFFGCSVRPVRNQ